MINKQIVERIAKQTELSETQINVVLEALCDITLKQVANGNKVVLKDYFTFYMSKKHAYIKNYKKEEVTDKLRNNPLFDESDNTLLVPAKFEFKMKLEKYANTMFKQITKKKK